MKKILSGFIIVSLLGCSHSQKEYNDHLAHQRCDEALAKASNKDSLEKSEDAAKLVAKNMAAYTYITASYTTEVLWDVTAGTIVVVGLCGPMIAASMASQRNGNGHGPINGSVCFPASKNFLSGVMAPPLGRQARNQTKEFRCPDLKSVATSIQAVARCYESKGDPESLQKAVKSLGNVESSKNFFSCLSPKDQMEVTAQRTRLEQMLQPSI